MSALSNSDEAIRTQFLALSSAADVAALLNVEPAFLLRHVKESALHQRYRTFKIAKKSGGSRKITAPGPQLKAIQRSLCQVLNVVYKRKPSVHGFAEGQDIVSNADSHFDKRYVLNIDLDNFFPSIHAGRVRGMFMGKPYYLNREVSELLTRICCFDNELPQGAPTSPIVSNMICAKMDSNLLQLAKRYKTYYTRYADDITFSTYLSNFPSALAIPNSAGQIDIGAELQKVVQDNGFSINLSKARLYGRSRRQEVTGLTVNEFPNVQRKYANQIRAMLHHWAKTDHATAQARFLTKFDRKKRSAQREDQFFKHVVKGKIEFLGLVRGKNDPLYLRFRKQLAALAPELVPQSLVNDDTLYDPYLSIEHGLAKLLSLVRDDSPYYGAIRDIEAKLRTHIELSRKYGKAPLWTTNIRKLTRALNRQTRLAINSSFTELTKQKRANALATIPSVKKESGIGELPAVAPGDHALAAPGAESDAKNTKRRVFISFSAEEESFLEELKVMLSPLVRQNKFEIWDRTNIQPGEQKYESTVAAIASAQIAVLLISATYLSQASEDKEHEFPILIEAAQSRGLTILWIAVRESNYEVMNITKYTPVNDPKKPIANLQRPSRERELKQISKRIDQAATRSHSSVA